MSDAKSIALATHWTEDMQRRLFVQGATGFAAAIADVLASARAAQRTESINPPNTTMSAESNKNIVRRFNKEVIEEGRRASFDELMDEAFVNRSAPAGTLNGPESMWNTFENVLRPALSDLKVTVHDQLCDGDKVTTRKSITGMHTGALMGLAATGKPVSIDVIDIVHVRDGRYFEHWGINTLSSVLTQLRAG